MKNQKLKISIITWTTLICIALAGNGLAKNNPPPKTPSHELTYSIHGVPPGLEENILGQLHSHEPDSATLTPETIQAFYQTTPALIISAIQPFGYFEATVKSELHDTKSLFSKTKIWHAAFTVTLGKPIIITGVSLQLTGAGKDTPALQQFITQYPIQKGQILNSPKYEEAKQQLFDTAAEQGYINAKTILSRVEVDKEAHTAVVSIQFDTGPRYFLGNVTFEQEKLALSEKYLRRFIPFKVGEPYSSATLLTLQQTLLASGDFESVQVNTDRELAVNYLVPIRVVLTPSKRNRYTFGVGYGTDTNVRGTVAWERKRINEQGHRLSATAQASTIQQVIQGTYTIPGHHPTTDNYNINIGYQQSHVDTGDRKTALLGGDYTKMFKNHWQQVLGLTFIHENFEAVQNEVKLPKQTKQLLMPSLTYIKVEKDDPIKPTQGYRVRLDLRGAYQELLSSTTFFQAHLAGKWLGMPTNNIRWIARGELGYTAVESFNDLPLSQRFLAGGAQSVRGYELEALGPGRYLAVLSAEHQYRVYGDWYLGAFFDMGNASNVLFPEMRKSAGVSLSWLSPIGTISLFAAKPLDKIHEKDDRPWLFQFNLGPDI